MGAGQSQQWVLGGLTALVCATAAYGQGAPPALPYDVNYDVRVVPSAKSAYVSMTVGGENAWALKRVTFEIDPVRHRDITGDGTVEVTDDHATWRPPPTGGRLEWTFQIDHLRDERTYDARVTSTWAMFRGDDLVPRARVRSEQGAVSRARMRLRLPEGWTAATPFTAQEDGQYEIANADRRFHRPVGWFIAGKLDVAKTTVAGVKISVASPKKHHARGQDILAFLRWTLPDLRDAMGELPGRILIVSAGDPMWRGGLSGPASLYLHTERPLIDDDFSSPILHEIVHAAMHARASEDSDWIIEGLAELYSIETLRRAKGISKKRYDRALQKMKKKGEGVTSLRVPRANAKVTGHAVWVLHELDIEMTRRCKAGLDAVLKRMADDPKEVSTSSFVALAEDVGGCDLEAFFRRWVPAAERPAPPHAARQPAQGGSVAVP